MSLKWKSRTEDGFLASSAAETTARGIKNRSVAKPAREGKTQSRYNTLKVLVREAGGAGRYGLSRRSRRKPIPQRTNETSRERGSPRTRFLIGRRAQQVQR